MPLRSLVRISILSSLGLCLMFLGFPLLPAAPYLKYDPGDVPVLIAAFALGPGAGVGVAALKSALFALVGGGGLESLVGAPLSFLWGASCALVAGGLYRRRKTRSQAILGLVLGSLAAAVTLSAANLLVLPWFLGQPVSPTFVLQVIVPFNLVKGALSSSLCFVVYKRVAPVLKAHALVG